MADKKLPSGGSRATAERPRGADAVPVRPSRLTHNDDGRPLPIEDVREEYVRSVKALAASKLAASDWYVMRSAEGGKAVTPSVVESRQAIRRISNEREAAAARGGFDDLCRMFRELGAGWPSGS